MSTEQNKTTILAFFDEVWNQGDESAIARYIAENAAQEQPETDWLAGRDGRIDPNRFNPDELRRVGER